MGKLKHAPDACNAGDFLSLQEARLAAEFFKKSRVISFLGGEPTLHPDFELITDLFLKRDYQIYLFTNGTFGPERREFLQKRNNLRFIFNINEKSFYAPETWRRLEDNLAALAPNLNSLAITIYRHDQEIRHVVDLARRYAVKAVKIGIAAPSCNGQNRRISFDERHLLADTLKAFAAKLSREGIVPYGECEKLKPCMADADFPEQMRSYGWKGHPFKSKPCLEGGNIDVGPDLKVYRCYLFSDPIGTLTDFGSPREMRARSRQLYDSVLYHYYPKEECYDCVYALTRHCEGGCVSRIIHRAEQRLNENFKKYFLKRLDTWKEQRIIPVLRSPIAIKWFSSMGLPSPGSEADPRSVSKILTDFLPDYDPIHPCLIDAPENTRLFPARILVRGVLIDTQRDLTFPGWRRTLWRKGDEVLAGPFDIYETDLRSIRWIQTHIDIDAGQGRAVALFYSAATEKGQEYYASFSPQGFIRLYPIVKERRLNLLDAVSPEALALNL